MRISHKTLGWIFFGVVILCIPLAGSYIVLYSHWSLTGRVLSISPIEQKRLALLGGEALQSNDVPVGALLLYNGEIIGEGFNTVMRDGNAAGHAEINAISAALQGTGLEEFMAFDRDSLKLISTFEPCEMCIGAILEYRIQNVEFLKGKPLSHWVRENLRRILYRLHLHEREPTCLQDSLFNLHPYYTGKK